MDNCEIVTIHYHQCLKDKIKQIFFNLKQQYATISVINKNENLIQQIIKFKNNIILKKRKIYLAVLVGQQQPNLQTNNYSSIYFQLKQSQFDLLQKHSQHIKKIKSYYSINGQQQLQILTKKLIQHLQLDFIWIGFLSRLGSSVEQFTKQLNVTQNFQQMEIKQQPYFLDKLNTTLKQGKELLQSLQQTKHHIENLQVQINKRVQGYVKQKFNSRSLIKHIIYTQYFKLLLSRNYFHLIYIECSTLDRFNNFQERVKNKYPNISKILTLQNFIQIDDFWYSHFIQKCTPYARFTINRILKKEPYSQVIQKYYEKIIRNFRPNFDEYFIQICYALKDRAGCIKQAIGSIIVKQKRIIATGYNGTPIDSINCYNGGCRVCNNSESINTQVLSCNCIHAEYSCILQAGIKITPGCTLYSTGLPCLWCTKLIIQAKIQTVIYVQTSYQNLKHQNQNVIRQTFQNAGVKLKEMKHQRKISYD